MSKVCTKCGAKKELSEFYKDTSRKDGLRRWCKECCRIYKLSEAGKKANRIYHRKQRQLHPEKEKAHHAVSYALRTSRLTRPSHCEDCLKRRFVQAHHEDYDKPLDVDWLCTECHSKLRKKVKA